ncbi:MAG TPA: polysaccharide deacetylase family protein, partial [Polyangiaceae bacterium]
MLAALYVACADPPKKINKGGAGAGGELAGEAGASDNGGSNASSGSGGTSGKSGMPVTEAGMGGEGGVAEAAGDGGSAQVGDGGAPPVDPCTLATVTAAVGAASKMPPAPITGVAKPAGTPGSLKVVNWAGFKGAISYTFDDATKSQRDHYTELNAVGVPMTFYLVSNNDASSPVWTTAARDGHELGNHTAHHCNANGINCAWGTFTNVESEMNDCTAHIESTFGVQGVYTFAAPNGDGNWAAPASEHFLLNRGISDTVGGILPNDSTNPFSLPCHMAA